MAVSTPALHEALAAMAGSEHVQTDPGTLAGFAVDGLIPRWVVRAGSAEVVSGVLAFASSEGLAVSPRGSGSALGLGNVPRRLDLVLDVTRLARVTEYVPEDMVASVEAGITLGALGNALSPHGQRLALDPPGGSRRTIGGVLAANASGPLRFRYGTGRDLLLGVRFVQADGTVTWGGAKVVKSVTGYDVPKLMVGSLGTLGVIVGATLRLHPVPAARGSWRCGFASADAAGRFIAAVLASPLEPERLVIVDERARRACGWGGGGPAVLVSVASVEEAVAAQGAALGAMAKAEGAEVDPVSDSAWPALDAALDAPVLVKVACEVRRLAEWLGRAGDLAVRSGIDAACVGQAGNGVFHVAVRGALSGGELDTGLVSPLREALRDEGGSVVVERVPHELKADLDVWGPVPSEPLAIMQRIKREFDPHGTLNPGRFVGGL
jgi:glycolate dehydrogenase FAD-binding subunit